MNALLKQLQEAISAPKDTVPKGWKTCQQLAAEWGLSRVRTSQLLYNGVNKGIVESRPFRTMTGRGVLPVPHYRELTRCK